MRVVLTRREAFDYPDGINIFIVSLAQALVDQGHDVLIVAGSMESRDEYERLLRPRRDLSIVALRRRPPGRLRSAMAWLDGKRAIERFEPDLVIENEAVPVSLPGTVVQVIHDLERRSEVLAPLWRDIRRFITRRSDHIVATTPELQSELIGDLDVPAEKIALIPKCIERQAYRPVAREGRMRAILHAGTEPYKQPEATIRAFGMLGDSSVDLYLTGVITDAVKHALLTLPRRLRERVTLMGVASGDVVRRLHGEVLIDAFPTRYAVPVGSATVMEALASGTPIVSSARLSQILIDHDVNGLIAEPTDIALAGAFKTILDDGARWDRMSEAALRMAQQFDSASIARQYVQLAPTRRGAAS
jgi:glycosyltransferase involved in cell wall biosynthesis